MLSSKYRQTSKLPVKKFPRSNKQIITPGHQDRSTIVQVTVEVTHLEYRVGKKIAINRSIVKGIRTSDRLDLRVDV